MTPVYPTDVMIEMFVVIPLMDGSGNLLTDENGLVLTGHGWLDVSADVLTSGDITWTRGNNGRTIFDRVANIGTMRFVLNNSEANVAQTAGNYSPDHASVAAGFGLDTQVRLTITENSVIHQEWLGTINRIQPDANQHGKKRTVVTAEDWMANAYRDKIRGIQVQTNKRDDEILTALLILASSPPLARDFSTGDDTYTYALHDENSMTSTLARVFQKLAMSGLGKIYLTISTYANDCWCSPATADLWDTLTYAYVGGSAEDTDYVRAWIPFLVTIPKRTLISATLRVVASANGDSSIIEIEVAASAEDNASNPTTQAQLSAKTATTAKISAATLPSSVGVEYSYNVTTIVQEILNRAGWVSGNNVGMLITTTTASSTRRCEIAMSEHLTYAEPKLDLVFPGFVPKGSGII